MSVADTIKTARDEFLGLGNVADGQVLKRSGQKLVGTGNKLSDLALPTASVDFNQQQALQLCIENRTSDPGSPATGQIWLRTDL